MSRGTQRGIVVEGPDPQRSEHERRMVRGLMVLDRMCSGAYDGEVDVQTIKLKLGVADHVETMAIVTALGSDGTPLVGFHTAMEPSEALVGALNRVENGAMRWRIDEYRTK